MMRRSSLNEALRLLFSPEAILPFLVASLCLSVISSCLYDSLQEWLGNDIWALSRIGIGALVILVLTLFVLVGNLRAKLRLRAPLTVERTPDAHKGLIFLVGRKEVCDAALLPHSSMIRYLWLVHSPETAQTAINIRYDIESQGLGIEVKLKPVQSAFSVMNVRDCVDSIYSEDVASISGLDETDVILDFTGMPALASVGAVLACLSPTRALQYTPAKQTKDGTAHGSGTPVEIVLDWDQAIKDKSQSEEKVVSVHH